MADAGDGRFCVCRAHQERAGNDERDGDDAHLLGAIGGCYPLPASGISGYLVKPVHQSDLLDAICNVLEKKQPQQIAPLVTVHAIRENRTILRVLLAEDNPVNQTLAVRLLERRGYVVFVASAGWKAVEALEKENFDVVLMDVQMPEMNGFEAAAAFVKEKN
jgi:DNA-binding NarL/FixJ family response regulator